MIKNDYIIRREQAEDYPKTENLVREAFWNVYKPGCDEHFVLHCLRNNPDFVPRLDYVLEKDGQIIGQIIFVKAAITDGGQAVPVLTFGPVCIHPDFQRQGWGRILLEYALEKAVEYGGAVFIEGNINYYSQVGFGYGADYGIGYHGLPRGADTSFFLCKELKKGFLSGVKGEYATPMGYFAAIERPQEFAEYESRFPYKEKLKLPGQLV